MKKSILLGFFCFLVGALTVGVCLTMNFKQFENKTVSVVPQKKECPGKQKKIITGYGYIRGCSAYTLKNKYGAYVKKVYFYSDRPVKKGDCILEYDDFDLRKKIVSQQSSIANTEKDLAEAKVQLELTKLDPLPSEYRNISWKIKRAKELLDKTENEWRTYNRLFKSKSVSELDLRSKKQAYLDALAAYEITVHDQETVNRGMRKLKIKAAEQKVSTLETKLDGLKKDLAILEEERKFYKIVTPHDGFIVTNSDTPYLWDNAGTSAAVLHRTHRGYYIYSYFEEKDVIHIPNGTKGRFFSNDSGKWYDLISFDVTRSRTATGEKVYHLVKFKVLSPVDKKVTLEGNGVVEVEIK
jgi:hypothetical protein